MPLAEQLTLPLAAPPVTSARDHYRYGGHDRLVLLSTRLFIRNDTLG